MYPTPTIAPFTASLRTPAAGLALLLAALLAAPAAAQPKPKPEARAAAPAATPEAAPAASREEVKQLRDLVKALQGQVQALSDKVEEGELEKIVAEAEAAAKAPEEEAAPEKREFLWGALALQKLNPEISFSADFVAQLVINEESGATYAGRNDRTAMPIREVGVHFQHVLDPYSMFKSAINFIPWPEPEAELEEVYITWSGLIPSLSFSVGRFRQNFGVINRWHGHDLDQTGYPLALELVLGEAGINQSGVSVKWFMPTLWAHAQELTVEVTGGENETLFAGEYFSVPTGLLHLKSYWDLSESVYLELGQTGMVGVNNRRGYVDETTNAFVDEPWRLTVVAGADMTLRWSPPQRAKYTSFTWRTEYFYAYKETADDLVDGKRHSWGVYSYLEYQPSARWFFGVRGDVGLPTIRRNFGDTALAWDIVPYATFWQSEFVYLRLEYQYGRDIPFRKQDEAPLERRTDHRLLLQIDFAAGPHKHEKY